MKASRPVFGSVDAVVIGASAGSIETLGRVLPVLRATTRVPIIAVLHLPPGRSSLLVELFGPKCALPVREPQDKEPVASATIYFAPPDYHLLVEQTKTFALSIDGQVNYSRPAIDVLFESAADVYGERLLAVVLTGANSDGAKGALAVRLAGGFVAVQDPNSAVAEAMPLAAIELASPQFVGTPEEIATLIRDATSAEASR